MNVNIFAKFLPITLILMMPFIIGLDYDYLYENNTELPLPVIERGIDILPEEGERVYHLKSAV